MQPVESFFGVVVAHMAESLSFDELFHVAIKHGASNAVGLFRARHRLQLRRAEALVAVPFAVSVHPQGGGGPYGINRAIRWIPVGSIHRAHTGIQSSTGPIAHLNTRSIAIQIAANLVLLSHTFFDLVQQIFSHFLIRAKAACREYNPLRGVHLHVAVGAKSDSANYLPSLICYELAPLRLPQHFGAARYGLADNAAVHFLH